SATAFVPGAATPGSESDSSPTVRWGGRGAGGSSPVRGAAPEVVVALVAVEGRDPVERPTAQSKVSEEAVPVEQRRAVEADGIARQRRRGPLTEEAARGLQALTRPGLAEGRRAGTIVRGQVAHVVLRVEAASAGSDASVRVHDRGMEQRGAWNRRDV